MKKTLVLLLLTFSVATVITSCKKDKDNSNQLLTSGKWYYDYVDNLHNVGTDNCFNETDYIEFKSDGTFYASRLGNGNYTLSDGGKTISITLNDNIKDSYSQWNGTVNLIKENYLRITILAQRELKQDYGYEITLKQDRGNQFCYKK